MLHRCSLTGCSLILVALLGSILLVPSTSFAYIGPGAGFAVLGSTFVFFLTFILAFLTIALWPIQWMIRFIRRRGSRKNAKAKRVVIVGLDGLEPKLVEKYAKEGKLPNLKKLGEEGSYNKLATTLPALSPVAWSTFQTGVNPGAHNIFDFLTRDKRHYLPTLSSTEFETTVSGMRIFGKRLFKRERSNLRILRKSQPFWKILGKHGIFSNVLRVPISYPPDKCWSNILSAMCTPDLKGTQGSFSYFTTRKDTAGEQTSGEVYPVECSGNLAKGKIIGPAHPTDKNAPALSIPFTVTWNPNKKTAELAINSAKTILEIGKFSPWIEVEFRFDKRGTIAGLCRFCLREFEPEFSMYVSPINIHPEKPALPISNPLIFSRWLASRIGVYGTLGLMEDTWGRNEGALDDNLFLEQTWLTHEERERMFFQALERTNEGVCVCVFDASDRIQHMFWRYLDDKHPSPRENNPAAARAIEDMYLRMDDLIGRVNAKLRPGDALFVMSDHGFGSFRRCVNLNTWLLNEGYLKLKAGSSGSADYLQDVDWNGTKAFALGLSGLYINRRGREGQGIVEGDVEFEKLKLEISQKLKLLRDPLDNSEVVQAMYDTSRAYSGLYASEAPDLIVGYADGFRVSWDSVTGKLEPEVFSNNMKAWSGDHHLDPRLVPGILFSNLKIAKEKPAIIDLAPTVLDLFAVQIPRYMEGSSLFKTADAAAATPVSIPKRAAAG